LSDHVADGGQVRVAPVTRRAGPIPPRACCRIVLGRRPLVRVGLGQAPRRLGGSPSKLVRGRWSLQGVVTGLPTSSRQPPAAAIPWKY